MSSSFQSGVAQGNAGSEYNGLEQIYQQVPYTESNFHQPICEVTDYTDGNQVSSFVYSILEVRFYSECL
jgi:hypothetical protein